MNLKIFKTKCKGVIMASMRDIKRRIKSVNSTSQITKAMKLVSTVKMQKQEEI